MATVVAALIARARRDIQHHFFSADAVRPERAVPFERTNRIEQSQFERMRRSGAIHEEGSGKYWIDVAAYDDELRRRHRRIRNILLAIIALLIVGNMLGLIHFLR